MKITTISSRQFNQDTGKAKRASLRGPVIITDRGRPAHVLLSIDAFLQLSAEQPSIVELLSMPGAEEADQDVPRFGDRLLVPERLS